MIDPPKHKRFWFQFSLRTLMIAVTLLAIVCGAATWVIRASQRVAETAKDTVETKDGYVPDADTTIKIAVAVWERFTARISLPERSHIKHTLQTACGQSRVHCQRSGLEVSPSLRLRRTMGRS